MSELAWVRLSDLHLPAWDVRQDSYDPDLEGLARSIAEVGLINPLTVIKDRVGYTIIAGRRRLRAVRQLGEAEVACHVVDVNSTEANLFSVIENNQRRDMSAIEEASAFRVLVDEHAMTQEQIAQRIGRSREYVANRLRLLKLDDATQRAVHHQTITPSHAAELGRIEAPDWREYYLKQTEQYGFSVASLRYLVDGYLQTASLPQQPQSVAPEIGADFVAPPALIACRACGQAVDATTVRSLVLCPDCYQIILTGGAEDADTP